MTCNIFETVKLTSVIIVYALFWLWTEVIINNHAYFHILKDLAKTTSGGTPTNVMVFAADTETDSLYGQTNIQSSNRLIHTTDHLLIHH